MYGTIFEYLRITPFMGKTVVHAEEYVKRGDKVEAQRRIFKLPSYDRFEQKSISDLQMKIAEKGLRINNQSQTNDVLLRFLYANQFDYDKTIEALARHIIWLNDPKHFDLNENMINLYKTGLLYLTGRDKQYRPTLVLNLYKINYEQLSVPTFLQGLSVMCILMEDYMFFDAKVENWNLIIETGEKCLVDFPLKSIQDVLTKIQGNFPQCVDKIFILSASLSLQLSWTLIDGFLGKETKKKVIWIKNKDFSQLKKTYEPDQLEKRFGGKLEDFDIAKFWPPFNTLQNGTQYIPIVPEETDILAEGVQNTQQTQEEVEQNHLKQTQSQHPEFNIYPQNPNYDFNLFAKDFQHNTIPGQVEPYKSIKSYIPRPTNEQEDPQQMSQQQHQQWQVQQLTGSFGQGQTAQYQQQQTVQSMAFGRPTNQQQTGTLRPPQTNQLGKSNMRSPTSTNINPILQSKFTENPQNENDANYQACNIF